MDSAAPKANDVYNAFAGLNLGKNVGHFLMSNVSADGAKILEARVRPYGPPQVR